MPDLGHHPGTPSTTSTFAAASDGLLTGPYSMPAGGGTVNEWWLNANGFAGVAPVRPIIYLDNAGEPDTLVATLTEVTIPNGGGQAYYGLSGLSSPVLSAGSSYWLGYWQSSGSSPQFYYDSPGGNPSRYVVGASDGTYSSWTAAPSPWPAASDSPQPWQLTCYVVYTAGSVGPTPMQPAQGKTQVLGAAGPELVTFGASTGQKLRQWALFAPPPPPPGAVP